MGACGRSHPRNGEAAPKPRHHRGARGRVAGMLRRRGRCWRWGRGGRRSGGACARRAVDAVPVESRIVFAPARWRFAELEPSKRVLDLSRCDSGGEAACVPARLDPSASAVPGTAQRCPPSGSWFGSQVAGGWKLRSRDEVRPTAWSPTPRRWGSRSRRIRTDNPGSKRPWRRAHRGVAAPLPRTRMIGSDTRAAAQQAASVSPGRSAGASAAGPSGAPGASTAPSEAGPSAAVSARASAGPASGSASGESSSHPAVVTASARHDAARTRMSDRGPLLRAEGA
jgi:hypothetical protein